jgi:hypothetical protein
MLPGQVESESENIGGILQQRLDNSRNGGVILPIGDFAQDVPQDETERLRRETERVRQENQRLRREINMQDNLLILIKVYLFIFTVCIVSGSILSLIGGISDDRETLYMGLILIAFGFMIVCFIPVLKAIYRAINLRE